jgi:uncharacterized protein
MLLDTSGLYSLLSGMDPFHAAAAMHFRGAARRLVHSYVFAELIALATTRRFSRSIVIDLLYSLVRDPNIATIWVDEALHLRALDLLLARPDKTYSLCDAVSFVLMRDQGLTAALTTDRHFEQEGFERLLV